MTHASSSSVIQQRKDVVVFAFSSLCSLPQNDEEMACSDFSGLFTSFVDELAGSGVVFATIDFAKHDVQHAQWKKPKTAEVPLFLLYAANHKEEQIGVTTGVSKDKEDLERMRHELHELLRLRADLRFELSSERVYGGLTGEEVAAELSLDVRIFNGLHEQVEVFSMGQPAANISAQQTATVHTRRGDGLMAVTSFPWGRLVGEWPITQSTAANKRFAIKDSAVQLLNSGNFEWEALDGKVRELMCESNAPATTNWEVMGDGCSVTRSWNSTLRGVASVISWSRYTRSSPTNTGGHCARRPLSTRQYLWIALPITRSLLGRSQGY